MSLEEIIEKLKTKKGYYEKIDFTILAKEIGEIIEALERIKENK